MCVTEGPSELRVEWWKSRIGRNRRGPITWLTLGPADVRAAPEYPAFLIVGRHRAGYSTSLDLATVDARVGDPEVDRVLRIHADDPAAVARFLGPSARARMVKNPEWETTVYRDGWSDDEDAPAVTLLRVMIPGHCHDEDEIDAARALLGDLAAGR